MIVQNPDSLAAEALQVAQAAQKTADAAKSAASDAQSTATEASGQAASAQARANASARMYNRDILNPYSLEQIYQLGQTADVALGTMTWESSSVPNAKNCFLLLGAWTVIAISYDGTLWRLDNNPYRLTQI